MYFLYHIHRSQLQPTSAGSAGSESVSGSLEASQKRTHNYAMKIDSIQVAASERQPRGSCKGKAKYSILDAAIVALQESETASI